MLLLCLNPFHNLPAPLGAEGRLGLQDKTTYYILKMLSLDMSVGDSVRVLWQIEAIAGDVAMVVATGTKNQMEML